MDIKKIINDLGKKRISIIIIGMLIVLAVAFLAINLVSSEPVKIINMNEDVFNSTLDNGTNSYSYSVGGSIINLPVESSSQDGYISLEDLKGYKIVGEFRDSDEKVIYRDDMPILTKTQNGLNFNVYYFHDGEPINVKNVVITITDEKGEIVATESYTFIGAETTTNSSQNNSSSEDTSDSMSPEEQFIQDYDTNGDNLLDSNEFPYSKFEEINSEDINKGLDPYPSIQMLIEDFDIDLDHKLSVDELKNIANLNL